MQQGQIDRAAKDAFITLQIADENRRLEYCLAIKTTVADKFPKPGQTDPTKAPALYIPGNVPHGTKPQT